MCVDVCTVDNGPHTCIDNPNSRSLDVSKLKKFMNTIHPVCNEGRLPNWNLITKDHFTTMYANELNPNALYTDMLQESLPKMIWTNYAPCLDCVQTLIKEYKDEAKPIIYIGRLVKSQDQDTTQVVRALQCMARLIHEGFEIRAWNINKFKQPLDSAVFTDACNTEIDKFNANEGFRLALLYLSNLVDFIKKIGKKEENINMHVHTWCTT